MSPSRVPRCIFVSLLLFSLALLGCQKPEPTRWDQAEQQSREQPRAVAKEAVSGGSLNRYFPKQEAPYDLVFKQEKKGFAQASLKKDGREVAQLSISDTTSNPAAAAKYKGSQAQIVGFPSVAIGSQGTGILVGDRFQVQVRSMDSSFGRSEREEWLQRFNLPGLAGHQ